MPDGTTNGRHVRHLTATFGTVALVSVVIATVGTGAFAAPAHGVKGDPQPELKPFKIGAATSPGDVALEPSGQIVVAYQVGTTNDNGASRVCVLKRGAHSCSTTTTLSSPDDQDLFGNTQVLIPSENDVDVLQNTTTNTYVIRSTDGGRTFTAGVPVGEVGVDLSTLVGHDIVWVSSGNSIQVQSVSATSPTAPASVATMSVPGSVSAGIGTYKGGVLVGSDNDESGPTDVEYAPSGNNFNASSSYHRVATFKGEAEVAMSGNALLTLQTAGKDQMMIRFFNGSGFGAAHAVPGTAGCSLGCWVTMDKSPNGRTYFFSETSHSSPLYDLFERSTRTGSSWSGPINLGDAIQNTSFAAAVDSLGSGLVLGTDPAWGYPVLGPDSVTFKLKASSIKKGKSTKGSGKVSPGVGRTIRLEVERSGKWFVVATTGEHSNGKFTFTIKGSSKGTFRYRAVASDDPGKLLYGYSPRRTLRVAS